jgi:hypothetical protein
MRKANYTRKAGSGLAGLAWSWSTRQYDACKNPMVRSRWGINLVATRKTYGNKLKSSVIFIAILLVMMKPGRFSGHRPFGRNPPLGMGLARGPFFLANMQSVNGSLQDEMV